MQKHAQCPLFRTDPENFKQKIQPLIEESLLCLQFFLLASLLKNDINKVSLFCLSSERDAIPVAGYLQSPLSARRWTASRTSTSQGLSYSHCHSTWDKSYSLTGRGGRGWSEVIWWELDQKEILFDFKLLVLDFRVRVVHSIDIIQLQFYRNSSVLWLKSHVGIFGGRIYSVNLKYFSSDSNVAIFIFILSTLY